MRGLVKTTLFMSICMTATASRLRGRDNHRQLSTVTIVDGKCTLNNFEKAVGGRAKLADLLGVENVPQSIRDELDRRCKIALEPKMDLSDTLGMGPQYLKNFLDGGTTWNDNYENDNGEYLLRADTDIINSVYQESAKNVVFATPDGGTSEHYPQYFSNFFRGDQECPLGVIECCYTASRGDVALPGNAEMCALDMTGAAKSNHIKSQSYTFFDTQPSNEMYCSGFAYEKESFGDAVKYNTLFHMAMKKNLRDNGLVKNIPGAPLCGCVEQMPIVDNADCVKAMDGYTIDGNGNIGVNIRWRDCGMDLYSYYEGLSGRNNIEKYFVKSKVVGKGQCLSAALSFMNDRMLVPNQ